MSFYATVAGYIQYQTLAFLEAAVARLQTGGWLDDRQRWWVDGRVIEHDQVETIDTDQLVLVIPPGLYRNLAPGYDAAVRRCNRRRRGDQLDRRLD